MFSILKLVAAAVLGLLVLCGVAVYDLTWNDGALFFRLSGREALVSACTRPLEANLTSRGFSPVDLVLGEAPSISALAGAFGHRKNLADSFTFSDGQSGPRIDGRVRCTVSGSDVKVEVDVDELPRRVT